MVNIRRFAQTQMVNIRRVAETQMVSVRKRNIQGRYNSVRHLQRRYLELPPLRVVSIVDSIVTSSKQNKNNHLPALSSHNSVTVNLVGVNTRNRKKP